MRYLFNRRVGIAFIYNFTNIGICIKMIRARRRLRVVALAVVGVWLFVITIQWIFARDPTPRTIFLQDRQRLKMATNKIADEKHGQMVKVVTSKITDNVLTPSRILPPCMDVIKVSTPVSVSNSTPTWEQLENRFTMLQDGGNYRPPDCRARKHVAIIIPFRNRTQHLKLFLQHMHPFLQRQNLDYTIYVTEQEDGTLFNRAQLMNIGYIEGSKIRRPDCVVLHDVDMLPGDLMISYSCQNNTVNHPTMFVRQYGFTLPRGLHNYFGGVLITSDNTYRQLNGFSNVYWGWGGEDDDFKLRVRAKRIPIQEPKDKRLWYESWKGHPHEPVLTNRMAFLQRAVSRMHKDGLNSVDYKLLKVEKLPLYTRIYVALNDTKQYYKDLKPIHKPY